jgi:hypothetical protein
VKVGLGTDEEEDVGAVAVTSVAQLNLRPGQFGGDPVDDARDGASRALVDEVFGVEGGENFGVNCVEHGANGVGGAESGVNPALETHDENGLAQFGVGKKDDAVVNFVVH